MGNFGCFNDCSTATSVPLLAISTIVIANHGWLTRRWLFMRPGVILGVTTGIGVLLIIVASVCTWLFLVNRLILAQGKVQKQQQRFSFMAALKTRLILFWARFSRSEDSDIDSSPQEPVKFIPSSGVVLQSQRHNGIVSKDEDPADSASEAIIYQGIDDGYAQNEGPACSASEVVINHGIGGYESHQADNVSEAIHYHGMDDCAQDKGPDGASEVIDYHGIHDYAQDEGPSDGAWEAVNYHGIHGCAHDEGPVDGALEGVNYHGIDGYAQCKGPAVGALEAINYHSLDGFVQDESPADGFSEAVGYNGICYTEHGYNGIDGFIQDEGPADGFSEAVGYNGIDGYTEHGSIGAHDRKSMSINLGDKQENTSITDKMNVMPYSISYEDDCQRIMADWNTSEGSGFSMVSGVPFIQEEIRMPLLNQEDGKSAIAGQSLVANCLHNHDQAAICISNDFEHHNLETTESISEQHSLEISDSSQNELDNDGDDDLPSSTPFGDSTIPSNPFTDKQAQVQEDGGYVRDCSSVNASDLPYTYPHPADPLEEEMLQKMGSRIVLELAESLSLGEEMDVLDHVNLVFSSLETAADGSLVVVLRQHN